MRKEPVVTKFSQIEGSGLSTFLYVGMDVHKNSIEVAIAGPSGFRWAVRRNHPAKVDGSLDIRAPPDYVERHSSLP